MINGALLLMGCIWDFSDLAGNVTAFGGDGGVGRKDTDSSFHWGRKPQKYKK